MAYITKSNFKKLSKDYRLPEISKINTGVYKKNIYILTKNELSRLKSLKELLKDPEKFSNNYYLKFESSYKRLLVYPETKPSYHINGGCNALTSDFINYYIPSEIQERGDAEISKFRRWFEKNKELHKKQRQDFIEEMAKEFNLTNERDLTEIIFKNTGFEKIENYTLSEIEAEIDKLLFQAGKFYNENPDKQEILKSLQKAEIKLKNGKLIGTNRFGISQDDLINFLIKYESEFKQPLFENLKDYLILYYNPNCEVEVTVFEKMGFKPCGLCSRV